MPLPQINLDDRQFKDIYQELVRRIPAYTPEWTDFNDSDPGITLLQLFSWLTEMLIYRINQVPEKSFVKFLELVGVPLLPPASAVTQLQFTLAKNAPAQSVLAGTQVALGSSSGALPVVFETDFDLLVTGLNLVSVQSFDGLQFTDSTAMNASATATGYAPLSETPQANAALYMGFDQPFPAGVNRLTLLAAQGDTPTPVQGGVDPLASISPPVQAFWEYWAGQWKTLPVQTDTTFALTRSGYVSFQAPTDAQPLQFGLLTKPNDPALFWVRYRIASLVADGYEVPPSLQSILLNTVSATNRVTETNELLGASNGRPNQTFQLAFYPVLPLQTGQGIAVDEGSGYTLWTRVEDFAGSGPNDTVYMLDYSTGLVSFADGKQGKIPRWLSGNGSNLDSADQTNVMAVSYCWGGGAAANSGVGTITTLQATIPNIQGVSNPVPSYGGADEETVAQAQDRAPQTLQTANRAVTNSDFAFLAQQTPGAQIARAQAFPLLNPKAGPQREHPAVGLELPGPTPPADVRGVRGGATLPRSAHRGAGHCRAHLGPRCRQRRSATAIAPVLQSTVPRWRRWQWLGLRRSNLLCRDLPPDLRRRRRKAHHRRPEDLRRQRTAARMHRRRHPTRRDRLLAGPRRLSDLLMTSTAS
jgi:predicted phage baseplate assembly protein